MISVFLLHFGFSLPVFFFFSFSVIPGDTVLSLSSLNLKFVIENFLCQLMFVCVVNDDVSAWK